MRRSDGASNGDEPSPEEVDRALRALWSGDGSSLDRLVPTDGDGADRVPVDRLARGLLRPAPVPARTAGDDRPPMVEVEGYTILHPLGRGGMGDVYFAEQHHPRRSVALKVARAGLGRDAARDRLLANEAEMLARLQHPGIATIYDVGETHDGRRIIAMELVEGTRLDHWLAEEDRPLARRLELFRGICGAVAYAHRQGVIHRDLKPTNILVDRGGDPKILDFGLAQGSKTSTPLDPQVLATGRLIGTLPYMSPEQVTGRFDEVDGRSDLYSIGVMLYLAITGRLPYPIHEDRPGEAVRAICELPPTPPRALDRSVPARVEGIVMRALQKDRSDRFADAAEMQHALARALETIAARGAEGSVLRRPETWSPPFLATVLLGFVAIGLAIGAAITVALTSPESDRARAAEASAATSGGVGRFFHDWFLDLKADLLVPARPFGSLLDHAAARLAADDRLTPPSRARAHAAIGQKYRRLGERENAALHYERAWRIRVVEFGPGDRRTLRTMHVVGRLRLQLGHLAEADALSRDELRRCLALGETVQTQRARRLRADVLDALGRADEAAAVRAAIVEVAEPDEDDDDEDADDSDDPDEGAAPPE